MTSATTSKALERLRCMRCGRTMLEMTRDGLKPDAVIEHVCRSCNTLNVIRGQ